MGAEATALGKRAASLAAASKSAARETQEPEPAPASARRALESRGAKPLAGKTCVVTGPTHGIGRPTANELLAKLGMHRRTQAAAFAARHPRDHDD